jgi:tetratricopeptide (TPR) repeat protein
MSALPRPDLPPGPHRDLAAELHELHHRAGWPSLRALARGTGVSHTTVSKTFSRPLVPSWGTLELLVEAMGGDTAHFHDLWLAASTPVDGPHRSRTTPMAGRTTELAAVRRHLETGTGLLLVTGEAGIGKTTLMRAAAEQVDAFVALGHCLPMSTEAPLMPVADALRTILEADSAWFDDALRECPTFVPRALQRLLPELEAGDPGVDTSQQLFAAVARLLARLGERRPLGLVVEDLHWADTATLDLVEHLVASGANVSLVGSWRTHDRSVSDGHVDWLSRVQRLVGPSDDLPPLSPDETAEQLRLLVGASATPELAARIHRRSRGHPLFTAHLAAGLATQEAMPRHLAEVLDRRLGHLGDVAGRVAAVLGISDRDLPAPVLGDAARVAPETLLVGLKELSSRELVTQDAQDHVALSHPLLAEAARRRLVAGEARAVHAALAAALGSQPTREEHAAEIAAHWRHAAEPGAELGARVEAARLAHLRTAPKEESEHWLRALEVAGESPDLAATFDRTEAVIGAIDALQLCNRLEDALALARAALQHVGQVDPLTEAEILRRAAQVEAIAADDGDACLALTDRAVELLRPLPPSECLVHTLDLRANELSRRGAHEEAVAAVREALTIATDLGDPGLYYGSSATLLWQLAHQGDLAAALRQLALARERHPAPAGPHREAYMSMCVSDALLLHRRPAAEVVAATRRAFDVAGELGLEFHMLTIVRANVAEAHLNNGEISRAADALDAVRTSDVYDEWPLRVMRASVQIAQGSPDHALETLEHMPDLRRTNNLTVCRVRATARLWQGRADLAWPLVRGALELALDDPAIGDLGESYVTAARAAADLAAQGGAARGTLSTDLLDLRRRASVDPLGPGAMPVSRAAWTAAWEAERARLLSRDDVDLWRAAAGAHDRISSPHDAAYCRWRAAQCALRDGQGTMARRLLAQAASDAREHVPLSRAIAATAVTGP